MKLTIILLILLVLIVGCSTVENPPEEPVKIINEISMNSELILNEQDLQELGMTIVETDCQTEEYKTNEYSSLEQYSFCNYTINDLNDTELIIEISKFTNFNDLNGSYQYSSSHLYSVEGLISENTYGDQSKFRVNSEHDYGGEFNDSNIYYYHLWIVKDKFLIHITSKGSIEAKDYITKIGTQFMSKFE